LITLRLALLLIIAATGTGYAVGRRVGRREGQAEGLARAPLALRSQALKTGCCPTCGTTLGELRAKGDGDQTQRMNGCSALKLDEELNGELNGR